MAAEEKTQENGGWRSALKRGFHLPRRGVQALGENFTRALIRFRNWRLRRVTVDFVVIPLTGPFPERSDPPRGFLERRLPLPTPPMSLQQYDEIVQRLIDADNLRGVVFQLEGVAADLARLQSLRQGFERLKAAGKRVVVYTQTLGNGHYFLASAAERIIIPPPTGWEVYGLFRELVFLRDALAFLGVEVDNLQISPYKSAFNSLSKQEITPEQQEQLDWLLDDLFAQMTTGMAEGRGKTAEELRSLVDQAPLTAEAALAAELVDEVGYEDQLPGLLAGWIGQDNEGRTAVAGADGGGQDGGRPKEVKKAEIEGEKAELLLWSNARKKLRRVFRPPVRQKKIAVVSLEGMIIRGKSQKPPVDLPIPFIGGQLAGDQTILSQLRRVEADKNVAALVFYVDSRGGDALASDVIGREIERLGRKLPVIVYMGDTAASGGYYVSACAREIICQPGTITGSIGVVIARPTTDRLYENLRMNRFVTMRGERADLLTDSGPLTPEKRQVLKDEIDHSYGRFKEVVARGRDLPREGLDPICEGRVWTGRQAADRGLVDRHGGFLDALRRARELADLPAEEDRWVEIEDFYPPGGGRQLPAPFDEAPTELSLIPFLLERLHLLSGTLYLLPLFSRRGGPGRL